MQFTKYSQKEVIDLSHKIADNLDIIERVIHHTSNDKVVYEEFEVIIDSGLYVIIDRETIEITEFSDDKLHNATLEMKRENRNINIRHE